MLQPLITVALPTYNSAIAWLAMESLCRQQTSVPWELIIAEDKLMANGNHYFRQYEERLHAAGCVRFRYFKIPEQSNRFMRMPLSRKWKNIAQNSHFKSEGFMLQASDDYSHPLRIQHAYEALTSGYEWIQSRWGYFCNLGNMKTIVFDFQSGNFLTGINITLSTSMAMRLPDEEKWRGVDGWLYNNCRRLNPDIKIYLDQSDAWKNGMFTDGYNKLSLHRTSFYSDIKPPFIETSHTITECLPADVILMINSFLNIKK